MRKVAQRRLEGLLRTAVRADEGGKRKTFFDTPKSGVLGGRSKPLQLLATWTNNEKNSIFKSSIP
jgi:hypothetical protein